MKPKKIWQSTDSTSAPASQAKPKPTKAELELVLKKTQELVRKDPGKAAIILSTWINSKKDKKAA
jgi:hypothetical protein